MPAQSQVEKSYEARVVGRGQIFYKRSWHNRKKRETFSGIKVHLQLSLRRTCHHLVPCAEDQAVWEKQVSEVNADSPCSALAPMGSGCEQKDRPCCQNSRSCTVSSHNQAHPCRGWYWGRARGKHTKERRIAGEQAELRRLLFTNKLSWAQTLGDIAWSLIICSNDNHCWGYSWASGRASST